MITAELPAARRRLWPVPAAGKMPLVVNPVVNGILTAIFAVEVVGVFTSVFTPGMLPPGAPLTSLPAGCALLASCAMLFPTIFLVKRMSGAAGVLVSRTILKRLGDPLRKQRTLRKCAAAPGAHSCAWHSRPCVISRSAVGMVAGSRTNVGSLPFTWA